MSEKIRSNKKQEITGLDLEILMSQKERLEELEKKLKKAKDREERKKIEKEIEELKLNLKARKMNITEELS